MTQYKTINNLIQCRLASLGELIWAYRRYMENGGRCMPVPKSGYIGGIDINSLDYLVYRAIKVGV